MEVIYMLIWGALAIVGVQYKWLELRWIWNKVPFQG